MSDPFIGKLVFFRVLRQADGGFLRVEYDLWGARAYRPHRPHAPNQLRMWKVYAGDIAAAWNSQGTFTGQPLDEEPPIVLEIIAVRNGHRIYRA